MTLLEHYLLGLLFANTLEIWWFKTDLPVHCTKLLRWMGWRRNQPRLWPDDISYRHWYRVAWKRWLSETSELKLGIVKGLVCPGCMSLHVSWIAALSHALVITFTHSWLAAVVFIAAAVTSWPVLVFMTVQLANYLEKPEKKIPDPTT